MGHARKSVRQHDQFMGHARKSVGQHNQFMGHARKSIGQHDQKSNFHGARKKERWTA